MTTNNGGDGGSKRGGPKAKRVAGWWTHNLSHGKTVSSWKKTKNLPWPTHQASVRHDTDDLDALESTLDWAGRGNVIVMWLQRATWIDSNFEVHSFHLTTMSPRGRHCFSSAWIRHAVPITAALQPQPQCQHHNNNDNTYECINGLG